MIAIEPYPDLKTQAHHSADDATDSFLRSARSLHGRPLSVPIRQPLRSRSLSTLKGSPTPLNRPITRFRPVSRTPRSLPKKPAVPYRSTTQPIIGTRHYYRRPAVAPVPRPTPVKPRVRTVPIVHKPLIVRPPATRPTTMTVRSPVVNRIAPQLNPIPVRRPFRGTPLLRVPKKPAVIKPAAIQLTQMNGRITPGHLTQHRVVNSAMQHELKTRQEAQKAKGLTKKVQQETLKAEGIARKVDQEKFKTEKLKAQTQLLSTGKGLIWLGVLIGGYFFVTKVLNKDFGKKKSTRRSQKKPAP